jgi:hypothetical protein
LAERTFGWVQEAYTISHLKRVVSLFVQGSEVNQCLRTHKIPRLIRPEHGRDIFLSELAAGEIVIPYAHLKGKGVLPGCTRANSPCTGIVQAALPGQTKEYQSDWPADSYLRWAISVGFLEYDGAKDTCRLTESGRLFASAPAGSPKERESLRQALLSSPPVCRILTLLDENGPMTKFELGSRLGFIGEAGITSIPQHMILEGLAQTASAAEQARLLQDTEGTSDKYVRTICSWLKQMDWIVQEEKEASGRGRRGEYRYTFKQAYRLTLTGRRILNYISGSSKLPRVAKRVPWEMLATKAAGRDYLRNRRTFLIQYLLHAERTIPQMLAFLESRGMTETDETVEDDLKGLVNIGLRVRRTRDTFRLMDEITGLSIPQKAVQTGKDEAADLKDRLRRELTHVDHKYLLLLELGFDGKADRDYEIQTAELLTTELGLMGGRLGDTRKPDVCVYHGDWGLILDNKAYAGGYSLPIKQADEMARYLEENAVRDVRLNPNRWWEIFGAGVKRFHFAFVSGKFTGGFKDRLENLSRRSKLTGAAVSSEALLRIAEEVLSGRMSYEQMFELFGGNDYVHGVS